MCGIAGIYAPRSGERRSDSRADIVRMTATLAHRGPNAQGQWLADDGVIALGHTRLSILDLSPAGAQPMVSGRPKRVNRPSFSRSIVLSATPRRPRRGASTSAR